MRISVLLDPRGRNIVRRRRQRDCCVQWNGRQSDLERRGHRQGIRFGGGERQNFRQHGSGNDSLLCEWSAASGSRWQMTNDEGQMTKEARMTNDQKVSERANFVIRVSSFFRHSPFVIGHFPRSLRHLALLLCLFLASIPARAAEKNIIGDWLFDQNHVKGQTVKGRVGKQDATIEGDLKLKTG